VGNQNSDEIVIFKRDQQTGLLTDTGTGQRENLLFKMDLCRKMIDL
jgi:6-phosphogluconolactonase (cycloisomerase 2 family)